MGTGPFLALLLKLTDVSIMRRRRSDATAGVVKTVTESLAAPNGFNRTLWVLCIECVVFWFILYNMMLIVCRSSFSSDNFLYVSDVLEEMSPQHLLAIQKRHQRNSLRKMECMHGDCYQLPATLRTQSADFYGYSDDEEEAEGGHYHLQQWRTNNLDLDYSSLPFKPVKALSYPYLCEREWDLIGGGCYEEVEELASRTRPRSIGGHMDFFETACGQDRSCRGTHCIPDEAVDPNKNSKKHKHRRPRGRCGKSTEKFATASGIGIDAWANFLSAKETSLVDSVHHGRNHGEVRL